MDEFKQRQRAMWAAGDYPVLAENIIGVGQKLVERTGVGAGERVLDVACGPGVVALPAARAGAEVTGLDLTPRMLEHGRMWAARDGLEIEWVEGDAEELPFEADSFDHVLSTFGHMFAPRHEVTASEMVRVCREDGVIAMCCWTPEGLVGKMFRAAGPYMPPVPDYASPPLMWGTEERVRELFGSTSRELEFERDSVVIEWESVEGFADHFMARFPTMAAARQLLGERFEGLRADTIRIWEEENEADDGSLRISQEYLMSIVRF
jgi:SAM-dependent methyltransferase